MTKNDYNEMPKHDLVTWVIACDTMTDLYEGLLAKRSEELFKAKKEINRLLALLGGNPDDQTRKPMTIEYIHCHDCGEDGQPNTDIEGIVICPLCKDSDKLWVFTTQEPSDGD